MPLLCQVLQKLRCVAVLWTSFSFVFLKLKKELNCLGLILATLGSFSNVLIAAKVGSR